MTLDEYNQIVSESRRRHESEIRNARHRFAVLNAKYKIGDIVEDHAGLAIVKSIHPTKFGDPGIIYFGIEVRKDGKPKKNGATRPVYESNIKLK
jgi:hypothetical protein